jgi:Carboxypeptidase regulatory-like domain
MPDARHKDSYNSANVKLTHRGAIDAGLARGFRKPVRGCAFLVWVALNLLLFGFPSLASAQNPPDSSGSAASASPPQEPQQMTGFVNGTVLDTAGAAVIGAHVKLSRDDQSPSQEVVTGDGGQFTFSNITPGPFHVTVTTEGFATQVVSGVLHPGEYCVVPQIKLAIATAVTEVRVGLSPVELAEEEIKIEEKQRVFGVIPNFYVSYIPDAVPLTSKQKFKLAWRSTIDPVNFVLIGGVAGVQQWQNDFNGYGQGAAGYGRRYGAAYGNLVTGTFIGAAILPSLLKQDPRYFYKGTGTVRERLMYAIANAVICKGDNGHWQPNYSSILGSLAAGGISNLYYPPQNRDGAALTFENTLIGIGTSAAVNIIQEFVIPKLTPNLPIRQAAKP